MTQKVITSLVTLGDRTSRFTLVQRVNRKSTEEVADALISMLEKVHAALTVTLDNGGKLPTMSEFRTRLGLEQYNKCNTSCDKYCLKI
jgi:IS30 family transposase